MWFIVVLFVAISAKKHLPGTTHKPTSCGPNEISVQCKTVCPPQSCEISYTDYACNEPIPCTPGCDCIENYLRNSSGICILNDECPPPPSTPVCGLNEQEVPCKTVCPPQSCDISYTDYFCSQDILCTPGCDCIENYLRNSSGICILNDDCPPPPWSTPTERPTSTSPPNCKTKSSVRASSHSKSSAHSEAQHSSSSSAQSVSSSECT